MRTLVQSVLCHAGRITSLHLPLFALLGLLLNLSGCQCNREQRVGKVSLSITRADSLLFSPGGSAAFCNAHPAFAELWALLTGNRPGDGTPADWLHNFSQDSLMQGLEDSILHHFPNLQTVNGALTESFSALHAQCPSMPLPRIYYFNSGFNASVLVGDSILGIGLDRFLGEGNPYYNMLGIPLYLQRSMGPEWIVSTALFQFLEAEYPLPANESTLLGTMVDQGKKYFILQQIAPELHDTLTLPYSARQIEWLKGYEQKVWEYLSEHKLLFSSNSRTLTQFTKNAPFTPAFGQDSPGQAASYIGYRIVKAYMERHPSTPWEELMVSLTAQEILQDARYNPR